MTTNELREKALELLICKPEKLEEKQLLYGKAIYYRNTDRGGAALIMADDGTSLMVNPFFTEFEEHLNRFLSGERSRYE